MAHPIYVWRLDELDGKRTLHRDKLTLDELKVQTETYQVWLEASGFVRVEDRQEDNSWKAVQHYLAKV